MSRNTLLVAAFAALALGLGYVLMPEDAAPGRGGGPALVKVNMPDLAGQAAAGQAAFGEYCAACHGPEAGGIDGAGPPLIHKIYEPSHHGDMSFVLAARQGVRAHHWSFGNMPPVGGIGDRQIVDIIAFVRTVQRANGIQ